MSINNPLKLDEEELKQRLTPIAYAVLRHGATETPYSGAYNEHYETGDYHCLACGAKLFESTSKFESGCGWPAF